MVMDTADIRSGVIEILTEKFKIEADQIRDGTKLREDLGLDSVDLLDMICLAEEKFHIKIIVEGKMAEKWPETIKDLIAIIQKKVSEK